MSEIAFAQGFAESMIAVTIVGGLMLALTGIFVWYLNRRDKRCDETTLAMQNANHQFHRVLNDNIREAFKEIVKVIGEANDAMAHTTMASSNILLFLARHERGEEETKGT